MRIDHLSLTNFRRFEKWERDFNPQFNVLIGNNGTGKTAILDALKIALGAYLAGFSGRKFERIVVTDVRLLTGGSEDNPTLERVYPTQIEARGEVAGTPVHWYREITKRAVRQNRGVVSALQSIAQRFEAQIQSGDGPVLPVVAYYTADRLWPQNLNTTHWDLTSGNMRERQDERTPPELVISGPTSRLAGYRHCLYAQANEDDVQRWIKRLELAALQRGRENPTLQAVKQASLSCLPGFTRFYYDVQLDQLVVVDKESNLLPTRLLSHGQRNLLSMVADLAYRCAMLNPALRDLAALETPGVVLIDELDLHLHPEWQQTIVGNLKRIFPRVQFFATTHSPLIIQSLAAGQLIDLGPEVDEDPADYVGRSPEDILE